jgi:hypothetical protein
MEATCYSEKSVDVQRNHDLISEKAEFDIKLSHIYTRLSETREGELKDLYSSHKGESSGTQVTRA